MSKPHLTSGTILALVLVVGLIHGLIYVFLVPPWQHNDEPNHFEYAWLVAHRTKVPKSSDSDPGMSRAVMESMVANHFFDGMGYIPNLTSGRSVQLIGFSQLSDLPLYYMIASMPIRLVSAVIPGASIEIQLHAARLASLVLFLISLTATWGLVKELTSPANPLRWLIPLTLALWPGFIDLMTAVTNLVGAVTFFSLFLWFGVRLIRRGLKWVNLCGAILATAACLWTFRGVYVAVPLLGIAILFALFRERWRWVSWGLLISSVIVILLAISSWGDADLWYRETWQSGPTSVRMEESPLGKKAFQLVVTTGWPPARLYQLIPPDSVRQLEGNTVTLGAWMWATRPLEVSSPILQEDNGEIQYSCTVRVTETPTFHAITATLMSGTGRAWVILSLPASAEDAGTYVFFDGIVLTEGTFPLNSVPKFDNQDARSGMWGDRPFVNLVRNPSAEIGGPRIRLWADKRPLFGSYGRVSMVLYAIRDLPGTYWYFRGTAANLLRTLWGRFGWNHVSYLGHKPYRLFLVVTLLGLAGIMAAAWRVRKKIPWVLLIWLGLAVFMIGALTIAYGLFYFWYKPFIPSARYLYPIMPVIVFTLCTGWWELIRVLARWLRPWAPGLIYIVLFLGLDVYALVSLIHYYY